MFINVTHRKELYAYLLGISGVIESIKMNFFEKRRWKRLLNNCDYQIARTLLIKIFQDSVVPKKLAKLLENYFSNPCLETAVDLLKFDGKFIATFELSKSPYNQNDFKI